MMVGKGFKPEQTISNLQKFTKYEVHVLAYNAKGSGPKSKPIGVFTLEDGECKLLLSEYMLLLA